MKRKDGGERKRKRGTKEKYDVRPTWRGCFRNIGSKKIDHGARAQTRNLKRPLRREHEMETRTQTHGGQCSRYPRAALVIVCMTIVWRERPRAGEACLTRGTAPSAPSAVQESPPQPSRRPSRGHCICGRQRRRNQQHAEWMRMRNANGSDFPIQNSEKKIPIRCVFEP
jgi:hypothetical protein